MADTDVPSLPYELVVRIINDTWAIRGLSIEERINIISSFSLVSREFSWEFTFITLQNVHILTHAHLMHYLMRVQCHETYFFSVAQHNRQEKDVQGLCRSITMHLLKNPDEPRLPHSLAGDLFLITDYMTSRLPNTKSFGMVYHNWITNDDQLPHLLLPEQITELQVTHIMNSDMPAHQRERYLKTEYLSDWRWTTIYGKNVAQLPYIKHLDVYGGNTALATNLTRACPNVKSVTHNCKQLTSYR